MLEEGTAFKSISTIYSEGHRDHKTDPADSGAPRSNLESGCLPEAAPGVLYAEPSPKSIYGLQPASQFCL